MQFASRLSALLVLVAPLCGCFEDSQPPATTTVPPSSSSDTQTGADTATPCDQGTLDCACFPNGTCSPDLLCSQGICVPFATTATDTGTSTGDPDSTTSSTDPDSTTVDPPTATEGSSESTGEEPAHVLLTTAADYPTTAFADVTEADDLCTTVGNIVRPGPWVAVLADSEDPLEDRITVTGVVVNTVGEVLAEDEAELLSGTLQNLPGYDENGSPTPEQDLAWTGSMAENCFDWTSDAVKIRGTVGLPTSAEIWLDTSVSLPCSAAPHLYCISQ